MTDFIKKLFNKISMHYTVFSIIGLILTMTSVVCVTLLTVKSISTDLILYLKLIELFCVMFFVLEYVLRTFFYKKRFSYIFSASGIFDALIILPYFIFSSNEQVVIRLIRLIVFLRIFKITQYSKSVNFLIQAFKFCWRDLIVYWGLSMILMYIASTGIYFFEADAQPDKFSSIPASLWWAVATLTTVGYGDIYPITLGGKIFTFFILLISLGLVAAPGAIIVHAFNTVIKNAK